MERQRQSLEEILPKLSRLDASWEDDHSQAVIASLSSIPDVGPYQEEHIQAVLNEDYEVGADNYDRRCRFVGATGNSTEKTDFAIPSRRDPNILIEVKAYGATGSKQTDILGDVSRIVEQKRRDTQFLLVTAAILQYLSES